MPLHIASERPAVRWSGAFFVHHSLALVNRELSLALLGDPSFTSELDLCIEEHGARGFTPSDDPRHARLTEIAGRVGSEIKVDVRHQWPPDFQTPASGRLVLCQPW